MTARNLLLAFALLVANGFFVAVEFALIASRRTKLEAMAEQGSARARLALGSMRHLNVQLAGAQLGITMASLLLGYVAEPTVAGLIEDGIEPARRPARAAAAHDRLRGGAHDRRLPPHGDRRDGARRTWPSPIRSAPSSRLALPNRAYVTVFGPLLRVLNGLSNAGVRLLGVEPRDELATAASADELAVMLGASRDEGLIEEVAHQLLTGALDLGDRSITTVMVPRDGVVWLPRTATPAEAEALVVSSGHTRLLVAGEGVDDVLGFVHAKDLLTMSGAGARAARCPSAGCAACSC